MNQIDSTDRAVLEHLKFPIGPLERKDNYSKEEIGKLISEIAAAPASYRILTDGLKEMDLNKTYREGSWNIRQLIHHVADIQMLHFFRMKKALTENGDNVTTIILMDEWVKTADGKSAPIEDSLQILDGITKRYVYLMRSLTEDQLRIKYYHPVRNYDISQAQAIAMSAWHLRHHHAHIQLALNGTIN